ncbi:Alpha-aspartyl dipeptidase Peptidase E [plant metagenome]|uniref:Alpha-aspartyl dipeptidase Peptidase E n=1 Tax=plant metagenome TaxID=1297885 RepID=A0A484QM21_9ZZZZ
MNLLLLSNSSSDAGYLTHALPWISDLAAGLPEGPALFLPYAGVTRSWDDYADLVAGALAPAGIAVQSLHREADAAAAVARAALFIVGGGNTFQLLAQVRQLGVLTQIARRVRSGQARYLGWSAGANLACPTIRTTNDMPIVDPGGLDALNLVPFQINAHYTEAHPPGHRGETRRQRLAEFCRVDPVTPVVGLPEGTGLHVLDTRVAVLGGQPAVLLQGDAPLRELAADTLEVQA